MSKKPAKKTKPKLHPGPKGLVCDTYQIVKMRTSLGRIVEVKRCKTFKKASK